MEFSFKIKVVHGRYQKIFPTNCVCRYYKLVTSQTIKQDTKYVEFSRIILFSL